MVDPYVMGVIRLAERRGKLTGDLSRVQEMALNMLMAHEGSAEHQRLMDRRYDDARAALLVMNPNDVEPTEWLRAVYPEFAPREGTIVTITDADIEDAGDWDFSQSETTMAEISDVLASMGQHAEVSAAELDPDEGWI